MVWNLECIPCKRLPQYDKDSYDVNKKKKNRSSEVAR